MHGHKIVDRNEWIAARVRHLANEKKLTRLRDQLFAERRELPWVKIEKEYVFEGPNGRETLSELFAGRSQLVVKHFMFEPGRDAGCVGCSFEVDHVDGALVHLENHDVSYVAVGRAPFAELEAYRKRMAWRFKWVSSFGSDFNYDFHVSFTPEQVARGEVYYNYETRPIPIEDLSGHSVLYKDASGDIFHTYSTFGRGAEELLSTYVFLDMTPKGRNETGPGHDLTDWVKLHDRYGTAGYADGTGRFHEAAEEAKPCCHAKETPA